LPPRFAAVIAAASSGMPIAASTGGNSPSSREDARNALETSLSADGTDRALRSYALYYLGLSYEHLREDGLAREALTTFVRRTVMANAAAFQVAEERLLRLGAPIPRCQSTAPVPMVWSRR
jgi:hypothetical protein